MIRFYDDNLLIFIDLYLILGIFRDVDSFFVHIIMTSKVVGLKTLQLHDVVGYRVRR